MTYDQAMTTYGSDRPDLRYGMRLHDLTHLGPQVPDFKVFSAPHGQVRRRPRRARR